MIEFKDSVAFQKAVDAISSFISEGNFRFNEKGISFKAVDPSQIVLVEFTMPKNSFETFNVEPTLAGVDIIEFSKILSRALPDDKLKLKLTDSEMIIILDSELHREFSLPLLEISQADVKIPQQKLDFDCTLQINAKLFKEALKDASLFGSSVVLRVKNSKLYIEARGSQGALHIEAKGTKNIEINAKDEVVSKYSLNFLSNIVKPASEKILLELKSDSPMRVSYNIGSANMTFYLAHMIL
ncbi:MAG: proliferating cell nuclear antigen (pcna) [Candidatus Iainarchaeum archaeon]|uniref:DNA polymerase sliding clamp n=1 Tax=Candidatus Iainarchaeum sp. TaxID=3101447 RepID=A0A497JH09_9ARCH|nr:MAG: proliferating cell nuclear antigen (pcna) [Candidatus Diapherotrites archaeon]